MRNIYPTDTYYTIQRHPGLPFGEILYVARENNVCFEQHAVVLLLRAGKINQNCVDISVIEKEMFR